MALSLTNKQQTSAKHISAILQHHGFVYCKMLAMTMMENDTHHSRRERHTPTHQGDRSLPHLPLAHDSRTLVTLFPHGQQAGLPGPTASRTF
jgi:hypothetical protein